jgi:hypothetical protein
MVWNAKNLAVLIIKNAINYLGEQDMRKAGGNSLDVNIRTQYTKHLNDLENNMRSILSELTRQAAKQDDLYLRGHILTLEVEYFLQKNIQFISFDLPLPESNENFKQYLQHLLSWAKASYNDFVKVNMHKDALNNIFQIIEIIELAERSFGIQLDWDKAEYYNLKEKMENELELPKSEIIFTTLVKPKPEEREEFDRSNMRLYALMTDEQIARVVQIQLSALQLPPEKSSHIEHFIKGLRLFYQRCNDDSHEARVYAGQETDSKRIFDAPVQFVIINKATNILTGPSSNIEHLLISIGY